jgi:hypothetical protein
MMPLIYLLALAASDAAEPIPAALAQGRDLRTYDNGGMYRGMGYIAHVQRLREFVWTHWTKKQRGYVEVVFSGMDTANKAWLFIEPTDGRWSIRWDEIYCSWNGGCLERPDLYAAIVTVERCSGYLIFFDADDQLVKYL